MRSFHYILLLIMMQYDTIGIKAGHRCRYIQVTCRYTCGNTCIDLDPQIRVTHQQGSLRIQVWNLGRQVPRQVPVYYKFKFVFQLDM